MSAQLNAQIETMALILLCPWNDDGKNEIIAELNKMGIDGQDFYSRNYRLVEQYYHTFEKHSVKSPGTTLMHEMDENLFAVCASVLYKNPDWISDIDKISDDAAQTAVRTVLTYEYGDKDIITTLDAAAELTDCAKWQLVKLHQRAGEQLRLIASAIAENLPAFEKAKAKIANELDALLQHFDQCLAKPQKMGLLRLPEQMDPNTVIIPTMALPVSLILIPEDVCFYGLMTHRLSAGGAELTKDELLMGAKALSEKSKLEILLCLKEHSRYNLEIAELVTLTPATVSHHMNALLASGFVELEKKDGKVYYRLAVEGINRYLASVKHHLLS